MARVYSAVFIDQHALNGSNAIYSVAEGYVAIVRDVTIYMNGDLVATTYFVYVYPTSCTFVWTESPAEGSPGYYHWTGRQVLNAGQVMSAVAGSGGGADIRVSGYLLSAP